MVYTAIVTLVWHVQSILWYPPALSLLSSVFPSVHFSFLPIAIVSYKRLFLPSFSPVFVNYHLALFFFPVVL